ncbi:MAG: PLP-dependent aminotransferase family protein [Candidatus Velthaea sp.]
MASVLSAHRFAGRISRMHASEIREMLKVTQNPEVISFAGGLPAPELFPIEAIRLASERALARWGSLALQYSTTEGVPELREWVVQRLNRLHGTSFVADDVIITGGSQQALDLYAKIFIDPGDTIVVDNPTYLGALQAFDAYEPRYLTIETDAHGMVPESLEHALEQERPTPKFLYLVPNFQNPTGVTLAAQRRKEILEITERFNVPVYEDDPYGAISFEHAAPAPLIAHDPSGAVTYVGTASKIVAPGLRVAWMVIPDRDVREKIVFAKQGTDLHTGSYAQYILLEYVTQGDQLERHIETIRETYGQRRDAMLAALHQFMPKHVSWNEPAGGMFLWAFVDPAIDTAKLLVEAARKDVVFVPGRAFYPYKDRSDGVRLNFSNSNEGRIRMGIERLATTIDAYQG